MIIAGVTPISSSMFARRSPCQTIRAMQKQPCDEPRRCHILTSLSPRTPRLLPVAAHLEPVEQRDDEESDRRAEDELGARRELLELVHFPPFPFAGLANSLAFERRMWNRYDSRGATPLPAGGSPRLTSRCAVGDGAPHVGAPSTEGLDHGSTLVGRKGGRGRRTSGEGAAAARSRPSRQGSHPTPRRPMRTGRTDEYGLDVAVPSRSRDAVASIPPCSGATNAGA